MPDLTVAQNIFIGREPRSARVLHQRAPAQRAGARADRAPAPPAGAQGARRQPHGRQAADGRDRQGAVVRREAADHGRADRGAQRRRGRGPARPDPPLRRARTPASSTSRTGWTSCGGSPTGSRSSATAATSTRSTPPRRRMKEVISLMVGRELSRRGEAGPASRQDREVVLEVAGPEHEGPAQGRQLRAAQGRDPRLRRADGRRPHRGRAGARRRRQDRRRDDPAARPRDPRSTTRPRPPGTGSATCPRTASSSACCSSRRSTRTSALSSLAERFQAWGFVKDKAMRATSKRVRRDAAHQDAVGRPDHQEPLRRQPAEGRHRQVARQGLRHPDLRRADPRHRRRRQGGDLPAAQRARRRAASRSS